MSVNRRRTQLQCLYFEASGYCVWSKRLEQGQFGVNNATSSLAVALLHTALDGLIEGLDVLIKDNENVGIRRFQGCRTGYNASL